MSRETGYVSGYNEVEGFGFIRPKKNPKQKVLFRESSIDGDVPTVADGQEVTFEVDPNEITSGPWDIASSVDVTSEPADDKDVPIDDEPL